LIALLPVALRLLTPTTPPIGGWSTLSHRCVAVAQPNELKAFFFKKFFEILIKTLVFSKLSHARKKDASGKLVYTISAFGLCSGRQFIPATEKYAQSGLLIPGYFEKVW